jgi:mono/diheme cytochrome c family protein
MSISTQFALSLKILIASTTAAVLLTACGGGTSSATPTDTTAAATTTTTPAANPAPAPVASNPSTDPLHAAALVGKSLWQANCASCHGSDLGKGANPSKILSAISSNTGGMGFLKGIITADNASNIATYVANPSVN